MMKISLFVFAIILTSNSFSQSFGYFGKKNILRVNGLGVTPIFTRYIYTTFREPFYKNENGQLEQTDNYFDGGLSLNYARVVGKRFAIGLEYSINWWNLAGPIERREKVATPLGDKIYIYNVKHEMLDLHTQHFMPKIHFSPGKSLFLPIDCEFGVGYARIKFADKNYLSEEILNSIGTPGTASVYIQRDLLPNQLYHSITLLYGINTKIPINRSLFFNVGIRYTHNLDTIINYYIIKSNYNEPGGYWDEQVAVHRTGTFFTANLGFMVVF